MTATRTEVFAHITHRVEADALPVPTSLNFHDHDTSVHLTLATAADSEAWAAHLKARASIPPHLTTDRDQWIHTWYRLDLLGWVWCLTAYAPVDAEVATS